MELTKEQRLKLYLKRHPLRLKEFTKEKTKRERSIERRKNAERTRLLSTAHKVEVMTNMMIAGRSYGEMATALGLSRQRIHQIANEHVPETILFAYIEKHVRRRRPSVTEERACARTGCGNTFTWKSSKNPRKQYCCVKCVVEAKRKYFSPEEVAEGKKARAKFRYHNDPKRRESIKKATLKWRAKKIATDPTYKDRLREQTYRAVAKYQDKKRRERDQAAMYEAIDSARQRGLM